MPTITSLATATSVTSDDLVLLVNDPNGTPTTQKARVSDIVALASTVLAGATWQGTYEGGTTYDSGDVVSSGGSTYVALQGSNTGHTPVSSPTWWQLLSAQGPAGPTGPANDPGPSGENGLPNTWNASLWSAGTYDKGVAVRHSDGNSYVAVVENATQDPSTNHGSGDNWRQISSRGATGVKPFTTPEEWDSATAYTAGNATTPADAVFVTSIGASYVCINSHTSSAVFNDDLANWQKIAAPGGIATIEVTAPLDIDNADPTAPELTISTDAANGVPKLDGNTIIRRKQIPVRETHFRHSTQDLGVTGDIGGSDGIAGGTSDSNNNFSTKVEIARVYVNGDPSSTGDYVYQRADELEATLTFNMDMSDSEHVALYLAWVRVSDSYRIHPTYITPHAIADGVSTNGLVTAHVRATAPAINGQNNESYKLYAWVKNDGGFVYDATADGQYDIVGVRSYPVV